MTDRGRIFAARVFFWEAMDRWDQTVSLEVAQRQIRKIAEGLPPFTPIKEPHP